MTEEEFLLNDRIAKIQAINKDFDLENNSYISFSGGKDSTVLSHLIDIALPDNTIPRVFLNTGIEHKEVVEFVKQTQQLDKRVVILNSGLNIRDMLNQYGYPFKSKEYSYKLNLFQEGRGGKAAETYLSGESFYHKCPEKLKYQWSTEFSLKISDKCCYKLKKEPAKKWAEENKRTITITGIRKDEKGQRANKVHCTIFGYKNSLIKFHPLLAVDDDFENWFINKFDIKLCSLYYPPFNFLRTGCIGCPFNKNLRRDLSILKKSLPATYKQAELIWKPVYDEYRKIGYRLKKQKYDSKLEDNPLYFAQRYNPETQRLNPIGVLQAT